MKKRALPLILIILCGYYFQGQADTICTENEQDLHRFIQYKNTSSILKKYFTDKNIVSESDFLIQ
jgi:hypothetical protein